MLKRTLTTLAFASLLAASVTPAFSEPKPIKWATSSVGSSGHKALVVLAALLDKEMPEYDISVLPTAGGVATVKGFATGDFDGYYGSTVALEELKANDGRFKNFQSSVKIQPVQSLWCFTLDIGLAIKASDRDTIKSWKDLSGKDVYTGPLPFDTRRHLENAMKAVGVKHRYKQVDFSTAGSQLASGGIRAMNIYAAGGVTPPPWLSEASLQVDWAALNPTADEVAALKKAGFKVEEVDPSNFHRKDNYVKKITLLPFYYGFDVGSKYSTDEMVKMLDIIDKNADELAKADSSFLQISGGKMAQFQHDALEVSWNLAPIHPGLAKWLKSKGKWDSKWDANVAKM